MNIEFGNAFNTKALVTKHEAETAALPQNSPREMMLAHAQRQALELLHHAIDLENRLDAMWQEYRWTGKK